jgi:hypothetical protein
MRWLENPPAVHTYWDKYPGQGTLLSTQEFNFKRYQELVYNPDGSPRQVGQGGIADEFFYRLETLYTKVVKAFNLQD